MNSTNRTMYHPNGSAVQVKVVDATSLPEGNDEDDRQAAEQASSKKKAALERLEAAMEAIGDMPRGDDDILRISSTGAAKLTSPEQAAAYDKAVAEYEAAVAEADQEFQDHQQAKADQQAQQEQESDEKKQDFEEQF